MPLTSKDTPQFLRPFIYHGVDLRYSDEGTQGQGECPFCGKERKFSVNKENGKWDCKSCARAGNIPTFLRQLWENHATSQADYEALAHDRKLLRWETLVEWGVVRSFISGEWIIPGYNPEGKLCNLYVYARNPYTNKRHLSVTAGVGHQLIGLSLWDTKKTKVAVCEGPWDGMALYETLRLLRRNAVNGRNTVSDDPLDSLYNETNILVVPSCNVFFEKWADIIAGKSVAFLYDNDRKKDPQGKWNYAALRGLKHALQEIHTANEHPEAIDYLAWGPEEDQFNPDLPSGYDVRDHLTQMADADERLILYNDLLAHLKPIPKEWIPGGLRKKGQHAALEPMECTSWKALTNECRKALKWGQEIDDTFSVMLATIASTAQPGDQIWMKIQGPASCGKSTLCDALKVARRFIYCRPHFTNLLSGYKTDKEGSEDHSLLPKLDRKTFIIKDGDTLLRMPNKDQILSQLRDAFDRTTGKHYGHGLDRDYTNICFTFLLCGTPSLHELDSSELGERCLTCIMMRRIEKEKERERAVRAANQVIAGFGTILNGKPESSDNAENVRMKRMTGGYVEYLRKNAAELMSQVQMSEAARDACIDLATLVAYMRSRPSKRQDEVVQREVNTRLCKQLTLLAGNLAIVLNKRRVDDEVMRRVKKVAIDSCRGRTLAMAKIIYRGERMGLWLSQIKMMTREPEEKFQSLLNFMLRLGILERFSPRAYQGVRTRERWRLTDDVYQLFETLMGRLEEDSESGE